MELDPPTDSAQLWESVEDAIRKDTRAIGKRLAAAKKRLAAGKPVNVRDDDVVPHVERYFTPEVLEVVQATQPPESVFEAAGDLLRTMSEAYVLRQVAARAAALEDQHAQVIAHAGGDPENRTGVLRRLSAHRARCDRHPGLATEAD